MERIKLPRKMKKAFKKMILIGKDPAWKTKHVRINHVTRYSRYYKRSPTIGSYTVTGYSLY